MKNYLCQRHSDEDEYYQAKQPMKREKSRSSEGYEKKKKFDDKHKRREGFERKRNG